MIYNVIISRKADDQLLALYDYISEQSSPIVAKRYIEAISAYCESLNIFPQRGAARDDIRPGVRVTNYKKRCIIAFRVRKDVVTIVGIFYGGQDYESHLADELDE